MLQLGQVGWMFIGWWTILDTHRKLLSVENPAAVQILPQTGAPGSFYHTPFKGTYILYPSLTCLLPFIYIDLKWS